MNLKEEGRRSSWKEITIHESSENDKAQNSRGEANTNLYFKNTSLGSPIERQRGLSHLFDD